MRNKFFFIVMVLLLLPGLTASAESITKVYMPDGAVGTGTESDVSVYRLPGGGQIRTVRALSGASAAFANADSSEIWIFSAGSTNCDVVGSSVDRVTNRVAVGQTVFDGAFSPDGKYCFAVGHPLYGKLINSITVIDCAGYTPTQQIGAIVDPVAVVVTPDSRSLYYLSGSGGIVGKLDIPGFNKTKSVAVGLDPVDLALTGDGRFLFIACRGLDVGRRGGSQISVIDTESDQLYWIFSMSAGAPTSLALSPDSKTLYVTFDVRGIPNIDNLISYDIEFDDYGLALVKSQGWRVGETPCNGSVTPDAGFWLGCDRTSGTVFALDLAGDSLISLLESEQQYFPRELAVVSIDVDERIAEIEAMITAESDPETIASMRLDIAYLMQTAGRENDVVVAYQAIGDEFPASFAAVQAKLGLADFADRNGLLSQAAGYSHNALMAYARFLTESGRAKSLSVKRMLEAIERIANAPEDVSREYLEKTAKDYLKLSSKGPELAEAFYQLGVELHKRDEKKLARNCFDEVKNQLPSLVDLEFARLLQARLELTTGGASARYKIDKRKKDIVVNGDLSDWSRSDPLRFLNDARLTYNSGLWLGFSDLQAEIYLAKSKEYFYMAGSIRDDSLVRGDENIGDDIGFYFDFREDSGDFFGRNDTLGPGCFQIYVNAPGGSSPKATVSMTTAAPYEIASERTLDGYTFELAIPIATFGEWLANMKGRFGLGIEITDYDDADDLSQMNAMGYMIPRSGVGLPLNPRFYGYGEF